MQDINTYISGLLFIHDCVILPGFGGFIADAKSAKHDESKHTFYPPKKELIFNKNLTYNDGLLINYLAKNKNIAYDDAKKIIQEEVERAWLKLEKGEKIIFSGIGYFKYNNEKKLIFSPEDSENYLVDSYGLSSFRFPPLNYEKNARDTITLYNSPNMKEGVKKTLKWAGIIILPIIGILALFPAQKTIFNKQLASLPNLKKSNNKNIEIIHSSMPDDTVSEQTIDYVTDKRVALFYAEKPKPSVKKQNTNGLSFHIIGGSYKEEKNAKEKADIFNSKGFKNATVIFTDDLYRVSLDSFENKLIALHELRRIRSEEDNNELWLLSKKK